METTIIYWGYIGIMEKNMETTIRVRVHVADVSVRITPANANIQLKNTGIGIVPYY